MAEAEAPAAPAPAESRSRGASQGWVWTLIAVASVIAILSSLTLWTKRQALDTNQWVKASDQILANKDVRAALSAFLVDQLYQNVNLTEELQSRLPSNLQALAGPISAALRSPATDAVDRLLQSDQARALWSRVNRQAHATLVRILENKTRVGSTANGEVSIQLGQLIRELGQQLGVSAAALDKIPQNAGTIVIARSDNLRLAQDAVRVVRVGSILLFILVLGLYVLAAYISADRRRTVRDIGWALVVVGVVVFVLRRVVQRYVESLVKVQNYKAAAQAITVIGTSLLVQIAWALAVYGLTLVLWAFVTGPTKAGTAIRRGLAPVLNLSTGPVYGGAVVVFALLVLWSPTPAFESFWGVLLLAPLFFLGVAVLRTQSQRDFPGTSFEDVYGHVWARAEGLWHRIVVRDAPSSTPVAGAAATGAGTATSTVDIDQIERLASLHSSGGLTDEEYAAAKQSLLGGAGPAPTSSP